MEQPATDLEMMKQPDYWPRWPLLPVKRRVKHSSPDTGLLFANGKPIIYTVNMFQLDDLPGKTWGEKLANGEKIEFTSFEEMVAAGWEVD